MYLNLFLFLLVLKTFSKLVVIAFDVHSRNSKRKVSIFSKLLLYCPSPQSIFTSLTSQNPWGALSRTMISTDSSWQVGNGVSFQCSPQHLCEARTGLSRRWGRHWLAYRIATQAILSSCLKATLLCVLIFSSHWLCSPDWPRLFSEGQNNFSWVSQNHFPRRKSHGR